VFDSPLQQQPDSDHLIEVSPLRLDLKAGRMWKGEQPIELRPKPWNLMLYMARRPGELLSKQELMDAVWPDTFVTESSLNQAIKELRKALGDNARSPRFIETVHRRGFRLLASEDYTPLPPADEEAQPPAPLFGRSTELEILKNALETTRAGHTQFVFVTGEAGIGKTTVVRHFLGSLYKASDLALGWGQCYDLHGESEAYLPVLEGIDRLARGPQGEKVQRLLSHHAPSWHALFPWMLSPGQGIELQPLASTPARMRREFCDFIEMLAEGTTVLLWLEDLHWSDAGTIDLLETVARHTTDSRLLLIASYRPVDAAIKNAPVARLKRSLEVSGLARELPLEFLKPPAVGQIVEHRLGSRELPASLSDLLYEQTNGNPLFVAAALNHLLAEDLLDCRDNCWVLKAPLEEIRSKCPESLRSIVDLQRADASPEEAETLDAASAAGTAFDTQAVAGALNTDPVTVEAVLDRLANREQFLRRAGTSNWPDGTTCRRFEFIHDVFRESIYHSLAPGLRQSFHHRIAECMEAGFAGAAEPVAAELALHAELGGDRQRSITFLIMAAQRAQMLNAPREALAYLDRALTQLAATPPDEARDRRELMVVLQLIPSVIGVEGFTSKKLPGRVEQALALCDRLDDSHNRLKVLITQASIAALPGDWNALEGVNRGLIATSKTVSDPKLLVHQVTMSGYLCLARGDVIGARGQFQASIALLEDDDFGEHARLFGHDPTVSTMSYMTFTEWLLGRPDQAQAIARNALHRAEAVGAAQSIASALHVSMVTALFRGEIDEARRFENMLQQCLERNEMEYHYMRPLAARTSLLVQEDRPEAAIRVALDGIAVARELGALAFSSVSLTALAKAQLVADRVEDGLASIDEALECADRVGERVWRPESLRIKGGLLRAAGETQAAEGCLLAAVREAADQSLLALELRASHDLADFLRDQGREQEAGALLEGVLKCFKEGLSTADYREAQSLLSLCRLSAAR
jgi:DNA-binding winged helix-turn-helix (wHTH) protein/tetratricopeptide (TPR) repeat protein